jgi:hypothetical protein
MRPLPAAAAFFYAQKQGAKMQFSPELYDRLTAFAAMKEVTREEAITFILEAWLRENPVHPERDTGLAPDELNASNDG